MLKEISGLNGLSQSTINSICHDKTGYIWLATDFGLNKFDGRSINKYFWDSSNPSSICGNYINLVYQDADGNVWISTTSGLCRYDSEKDSFIRNPLHLDSPIKPLFIYETESELWFPTRDNAFYILNKSSTELRRLQLINKEKNLPDRLEIIDIKGSDDKMLLLLVNKYGLVKLNMDTGVIEPFLEISSANLNGLEVIGNHLYVSSYEEVYKISFNGEIVSQFYEVNPDLGQQIFLDIKENPFSSDIWLATDYGGVFVVDSSLNIIQRIKAGSNPGNILPENSIKRIEFIDQQTIVLGSVRCGGLMLYDSGISYYRYNNGEFSGPSDRSILCFEEDSQNRIWIGTDGGGLNLFDRKSNTFEYYNHEAVQIVTSILDYSPRELLIASYRQGLYFFNKLTGKFRSAGKHPLFSNIERDATHKIFKDSKENIWISDGELAKINLAEGTFVRYNDETYPDFFSGIYPMFLCALESKSTNKVWFCSVGGLYSYSLAKKKFEDILRLSDYDREYYGNEVYSIAEDRQGNLIIGTDVALLYYNLDTKLLSPYALGSASVNQMFSLMFFDSDDQLWVGTNNKLMRIIKRDGDTEYAVFKHLGVGNGIEYRYDAVLESFDGTVFMGSNDGITRFTPKDVEVVDNPSKVTITRFERLCNRKGRSIDSTLAIDLNQDKHISLRYSPANYRFEFNAFNIPIEEYTEYSYILENFEDEWNTGSLNIANYTNLAAGDYVFRVKGTNKFGQWNQEVTSIYLEILPPWYETTWFLLLACLFVITLVIYIWRESLVRLKLKHRLEIEKSQQEHLRINNQQKITFFTNVSHEIKTPLTLIYSPLKHLIIKNASDAEIRQALPSLYRNATRMADLIDQLLEFRKSEISTLKVDKVSVDILEIIRSIVEYFDYFSKIEKIKIQVQSPFKNILASVDRDKMTKILFNLVSNAIKYSETRDTVDIKVDKEGSYFTICVCDNGPGIPKNELDNIFKRYYQIDDGVPGIGIGLALTKKLVELHGGDISVTSEVGNGSTFRVRIPLSAAETVEEPATTGFCSGKSLSNSCIHESKKGLLKVHKEYKILIVEDEWEVRHYLKNELSNEYMVCTATDGRAGFAATIKEMPHLIISDVMMPQLNGYEMCKMIKNDIRVCHIPVMLLTAKSLYEHQTEGLKALADVFVAKPFDIDLLKLQIESLLTNRQVLLKRFESEPEMQISELTQSELDIEFLDKAISIVEENVEDPNFKVDEFVMKLGMSRTLVYTKITALAGKPIKDFIISIRLQKASTLLTTTNKSIADIAYSCGFTDPSYFSTVFKRYYGHSPAQYREVYLGTNLQNKV